MTNLKNGPSDALTALVKAGVEIALIRHDLLGGEEFEHATQTEQHNRIREIAEDAANAVQGIDTCDEHPIPEFMNAMKALNDYKATDKDFFQKAAETFLHTWMDSEYVWQDWQIETVADLIRTTMKDHLKAMLDAIRAKEEAGIIKLSPLVLAARGLEVISNETRNIGTISNPKYQRRVIVSEESYNALITALGQE